MKTNKIAIVAFVLLAALQIYLPASWAIESDETLSYGKVLKFRTIPVDPKDLFRGNYIALNFENTRITVSDADDWKEGDNIYIVLNVDEAQFATYSYYEKDKPRPDINFVTATVKHISRSPEPYVEIEYPFSKFYVEESIAKAAETAYRNAIAEGHNTYAVVMAENGKTVLKDVYIDSKSLTDGLKD